MLVISAPSGAGKTTIIDEFLRRRPDAVKSISVTTRSPRPGEVDGHHYRFVSDEEFDRLAEEGMFLEWATVHGNRYGTPREPVLEAVAAGKTIVLEVDVQGARSVRAAYQDVSLVFIEPPTWEDLRARLVGRGTDPAETIETRLANAADELAAAGEFDHRVVNRNLEDAVADVIRILEGAPPPSPSQGDAP